MRSHRRQFLPHALGLVLTLGSAVTLVACGGAEPTAVAAANPPTERLLDVPAITVGLADLESSLQLSGNLAPQTRVAIMATLPGTLARVSVQVGDRVKQGQAVATLDRREIDAQVDAAEASLGVTHAGLEAAEAALASASLEQARSKNLFDKGALPRQRLDAADTAVRSSSAQRDLAKANVAQAEAALRRAREVQRDTTLTSPINGVVVERNYDAGSLVGPGQKAVVVVADLSIMKLEAGVSELEAGRLRVGMPARIVAQALPNDVFEGRLANIAPEVDPRNRHFAVEVRTVNRGNLLSGMYGTATIPLERAVKAVAVPRDAVTTRAGKRVALRIDGATVQEVPVVEGLTSGTLIQISSGLKSGDTIVSDARRDVAAGSKVNPVFAR